MDTRLEQQETTLQQDYALTDDIFTDYDELRSTYNKIYDEHRGAIEGNDSVREYYEAMFRWLP